MFELGILTMCVIILVVIYYKLWTATKYWKRRGVPHEEPWIILGNLHKVIFKKQSIYDFTRHSYNAANSERYYGMYHFTEPCIVLKDLDLIKQVTIRDFPTFPIHSETVSKSTDPIMSQLLLFIIDDQKWHNIRSTLSPAFTSSKIKTMFGLINDCARNLVTFLEEQNCEVVETQSLFTKYSTDIIGNCCVGFPCNSFQEPTNKFYKFTVSAMKSLNSLKLIIHVISPILANMLKVRMLDKKNADYWIHFITKIIASRDNGVYRNDMMQLFLKAKNRQCFTDAKWSKPESDKTQYTITDHDIVCQTLMVLLAGHVTSASTLSFAIYELALDSKVQTRLQQEIDTVLDKCGEAPLCYDEIMQMQYLDAVVSETLRKWPAAPYLDRRSIKEFVIEAKTPNEKPLILESGLKVLIPIVAIHRDPKYYPNPDDFDPDRFYGTNKSKNVPFTYFPFGLGPRTCLGSRVAILEIKLALFYILAKFSIEPVEDTPIPMTTKGIIVVEPEKKCCLGFKPRKK